MQVITEEYRQLNRLLHESGEQYGVFGWRHAQRVLDVRDETGSDTVLDYGCGKGTLKSSLSNPEWLREYDPAVPGKDARPTEQSDLVVCTDVLEHVEPQLIDNVLTDLGRLAAKAVFVVIATRESIKKLPDGTSPHKIIENAEWWKAKLASHFFIMEFTAHVEGEVSATVAPVRLVQEIQGKSAVSETMRFENALRNCSVVKERVLGNDMLPRHDVRVCIVGFGPSLRSTWFTLLTERRAFGAKIVSTSGAHDFLISRGIIPDYHVDVDPREHKAFFTKNPHPDIQYWIASCCHPKLIDNLVAHKSKLALWHLLNSDNDFKIAAPDGPDPDSLLICGGSGVGARAINLFFSQGYRSFSLYGMDCSFATGDGDQHAGAHSGKKKPEWNVRCGERWFRSSAEMVYMARSLVDQMRVMNQICKESNEPTIEGTSDHCEFFFHGDGLQQQLVLENNRLGEAEAACQGQP
jgi:hypothetical protein